MQNLKTVTSLSELILPYQRQIEYALSKHFNSSSQLDEACRYALAQGGKRFRPALVFMMAKAILSPYDVENAALAVEFFHTASLIADDLPCMDNDSVRRGKPATHVIFGESTALLATYALISAGYDAIAKNALLLPQPYIGIAAIQSAAKNTGILGATGGQYLDLFPPDLTYPVYLETVMKKTVTLFEISFVLGWLFGGGEPSRLPLVAKAAYHFGMAFQILDDFEDAQEDTAGNRAMNAISLLGREAALKLFQEEIDAYLNCIDHLNVEGFELKALADLLQRALPF